jgi:hypothetical protein
VELGDQCDADEDGGAAQGERGDDPPEQQRSALRGGLAEVREQQHEDDRLSSDSARSMT